jgi:tRNA-(ms[2]io[6]A)-hydroxylase
MKLLAENLADAELAAFYKDLLASEARHHGLYVKLAVRCAPREEVDKRLHELACAEAVALAEQVGPLRMHSA